MITIEIQGEQKLFDSLAALERGWIDLRRVEDKTAELFHRFETEHFANANFVELTPDYDRWKSRHFPGQPIMRREDRLFTALTTSSGNAIQRATVTEIELGAGGEPGRYGGFHQIGAGRLPVRKVIDLTDVQMGQFGELIADDAAEFARAEGFAVMR